MLKSVVWDEFFLTGIEEIDVQHKHMIELVSKCVYVEKNKMEQNDLATDLEELWFYTKWHFSCEESLMNILGYDRFEKHSQEHINLLDELNEKIEDVLDGRFRIIDLKDFLFQWLGEHSHTEDKEMAKFVASRWN